MSDSGSPERVTLYWRDNPNWWDAAGPRAVTDYRTAVGDYVRADGLAGLTAEIERLRVALQTVREYLRDPALPADRPDMRRVIDEALREVRKYA